MWGEAGDRIGQTLLVNSDVWAALAFVFGGFALTALILRLVTKRPINGDFWLSADLHYHSALLPVLVFFLLRAFTEWNFLDASVRWRARSRSAERYSLLYICNQVLHVWVVSVKTLKPHLRLQFLAHHVTSIICYGMGLHTGFMEFFGLYDGLCEINTIFVNNIMVLKDVGMDRGLFFITNGILLFITQILFRVLLFPGFFWIVISDLIHHPAVGPQTAIETVILGMGLATTLLLLVLSTLWTIPIYKGLRKALAGEKQD